VVLAILFDVESIAVDGVLGDIELVLVVSVLAGAGAVVE
jgi:hypothetical protein